MTFTRRIRRGEHTYVYKVRTHREKGTGKVKQDTEYLGKEVVKDDKTVLIPPKRKRRGLRAILDYGEPMALLKIAQEFGLPDIIDSSVGTYTKIENIGMKTTILAINKITENSELNAMASWFSRTALRERLDITSDEFTPKRVRGILTFLANRKPDITGLIEEGIVKRIKDQYDEDLSTVVYDLTPLTYYGNHNDLARYGHAYRKTGEKQVNLVLAVTMQHKLPIHHKVLPGNIVSVSTIHSFLKELNVFGVKHIIMVLDRGFYSQRNVDEILGYEHDVIGGLNTRLNITKKALTKSINIENSRNLIRYPDDVIFAKEFSQKNFRILVYHDPKRRNEEFTTFYEGLGEVEQKLNELMATIFTEKKDMFEELEGVCGDYGEYFRFEYKFSKDWTFTYKLKHKKIQARTNRLGKTILFTSTSLSLEDVLKLYREKDVIDKTFKLMKSRGLTPLKSNNEDSMKSRVFLAYLGYLLLSLLRVKLREEMSLEGALKQLSWVREVVYKDGSRELPELTKQQKAVLKRLGMM